jgi:hypothetical protein
MSGIEEKRARGRKEESGRGGLAHRTFSERAEVNDRRDEMQLRDVDVVGDGFFGEFDTH